VKELAHAPSFMSCQRSLDPRGRPRRQRPIPTTRLRLALDAARTASSVQVAGKITGDVHDAVYATSRAKRLAARACEVGGIARELAAPVDVVMSIVEAPVPYAGFTARASGPRSLHRAERQLVWSSIPTTSRCCSR
jgi:hypothetical protein